jgi:hypothetical protein
VAIEKKSAEKSICEKIGGLRVQKRENAAYPNGIAAFCERIGHVRQLW